MNSSFSSDASYVLAVKLGRSEEWTLVSQLQRTQNFAMNQGKGKGGKSNGSNQSKGNSSGVMCPSRAYPQMGANAAWPEDELELSVMGDELHFNLLQITDESRYRRRRSQYTQQIGCAVYNVFDFYHLHPLLEVQQLELPVTGQPQVKSRYDLSRFVSRPKNQQLHDQPKQVAKLHCELYMRPDEPIRFGHIWWAFWRPITECILFKLFKAMLVCVAIFCCFPCAFGCYVCCKCVVPALNAGPRTPVAQPLLSGPPKQREPQPGECPGVVWRMLLWTLNLLLVAKLYHTAWNIWKMEDEQGREAIKSSVWMFIHAKGLSLLIYEPASLYLTHYCVRHFCPSQLPKVRNDADLNDLDDD